MEAIRRFVKVKNNQVNITLPDDFIADEVEVIILAKNEINYQLSDEQIQLLDDRLNEPESEYITSTESLNRAYACRALGFDSTSFDISCNLFSDIYLYKFKIAF